MQFVLIAGVVVYRRDFLIYFDQALGLEPVPRLDLAVDQIGDIDDLRDLGIRFDVG